MDIQSIRAGQAYGAARNVIAEPQEQAQTGFAQVAADLVSNMQSTEQAARGGLSGTVDPFAMVQALAETELAVETAVTLRDKVVEAYQEILRMPV